MRVHGRNNKPTMQPNGHALSGSIHGQALVGLTASTRSIHDDASSPPDSQCSHCHMQHIGSRSGSHADGTATPTGDSHGSSCSSRWQDQVRHPWEPHCPQAHRCDIDALAVQ
eukprot:13493534-Alexandrium_andersonii.AAC.1